MIGLLELPRTKGKYEWTSEFGGWIGDLAGERLLLFRRKNRRHCKVVFSWRGPMLRIWMKIETCRSERDFLNKFQIAIDHPEAVRTVVTQIFTRLKFPVPTDEEIDAWIS